MPLTAQEAIQLLISNPSAYTTEAALLSLASQVSVEAAGGVTLAYSGGVGGVSNGSIARTMAAADPNIRIIDNTQAAAFLESLDFRSATANVFGVQLPNLDIPGTPANDFLCGGTNSAWADTSKRFVDAGTGELRTLTAGADAGRIFGATELPAALSTTSHYTTINGVSVATLRAEPDVFKAVNSASFDATLKLDIVRDGSGTITGIDSRRFFTGSSIEGVALADNLPGKTSMTSLMNGLSDVQIGDLSTGSRVLKGLGYVGSALGLFLAAHDANAAWEAGNHNQAKTIMAEWAAGSAAGGAAGIAAALATIGAISFFVPGVGPIITGALVIGTSMYAAYEADEAARELVRYMDQSFDVGVLRISGSSTNLNSDYVLVRTDALAGTEVYLQESTSNTMTVDSSSGNVNAWHMDGGDGTYWNGRIEANGTVVYEHYDNYTNLLGTTRTVPITGTTDYTILNYDGSGQLVSLQHTSPDGFVSVPLPTGPLDNTNLTLTTTPTIGTTNVGATDLSTAAGRVAQGILEWNADYRLSMPVTMTNYGGFWNTEAAGIVSNDTRPGNQGLSANGHLGLKIPQATQNDWWGADFASPDYFAAQLNNVSDEAATTDYVDPLVLDLNGDGVQLTDYASQPVFFDTNHDGDKEQTGWVSAQDGILAMDWNGDGKINDISETLSEYFKGGIVGSTNNKPYANGFDALKNGLDNIGARLNSNGDNVFDATDTGWSKVKVWVDANHNGISEAGELKTFSALGNATLVAGVMVAARNGEGAVNDAMFDVRRMG